MKILYLTQAIVAGAATTGEMPLNIEWKRQSAYFIQAALIFFLVERLANLLWRCAVLVATPQGMSAGMMTAKLIADDADFRFSSDRS